MTDDQIKHMVQRFLQWRLPENFNPDCGISYTVPNSEPYQSGQLGPVGTNLFCVDQAEAMVRHMIEGMPQADELLPCDVRLPPATVIRAGCLMSTLQFAMTAPGRPKHFGALQPSKDQPGSAGEGK